MTPREAIASSVFAEMFGGTSDPALEAMAETIALRVAGASIIALRAAGFAVVEREPTDAMTDAGVQVALSAMIDGRGSWHLYMANLHRAMIQASEAARDER